MVEVCRGCQTSKWIENKTHHLCRDCNKARNKILHPAKLTRNQKCALKYPNYGLNDQDELFHYIWDTHQHISYISGRPILEYDHKCMAHVLAKKQYPAFRLNPENIVLLTVYEHGLFDQGTSGRRKGYPADWEALDRLVVVLKEQYRFQYQVWTGESK